MVEYYLIIEDFDKAIPLRDAKKLPKIQGVQTAYSIMQQMNR